MLINKRVVMAKEKTMLALCTVLADDDEDSTQLIIETALHCCSSSSVLLSVSSDNCQKKIGDKTSVQNFFQEVIPNFEGLTFKQHFRMSGGTADVHQGLFVTVVIWKRTPENGVPLLKGQKMDPHYR